MFSFKFICEFPFTCPSSLFTINNEMEFEEKLKLLLEKARNQLDNSDKFKELFEFIFSDVK